MNTTYLYRVLVAGTISLLAATSVLASPDYSMSQIREWVQRGEILPLETILKQHQLHGRLLDLEVEHEHGRLIYELELLRDDGHVVEIEVDARNGRILKESID